MQKIEALEAPSDRRRPAVLREPDLSQHRQDKGHESCPGCPRRREGPPAVDRSTAAVEGAPWQELQGRLGMLHWLETGLERLRERLEGRNDEGWAAAVLAEAQLGMLEALEEVMFYCDELQVHAGGNGAGRGGGNGRSSGGNGVCALQRVYDSLEGKLLLHMRRQAEAGEVTP